jgi:hypothetical protein
MKKLLPGAYSKILPALDGYNIQYKGLSLEDM